jgi:hypothetical protein
VFGLQDGADSTSAIVMELVDGDDLSAILARGPIDRPSPRSRPRRRVRSRALKTFHAAGGSV